MYRPVRPDGADMSVRVLRSPSISSDVMSTSTRSITSTLPFALPQPVYVAQSEASKLISSELDRNVALLPSALALVNDFLDHVLFTILSTSRSLSLGALRASVPIVLKPRLGKAAVRVAEEELKEYLDEDDDVETSASRGTLHSRYDFDVELAWKLTRLRCMVYTRLGDLEEEDEEEWLEREQLLEQANMPERAKQGDIMVDPASAIFLTSVIEYLGEQALYYAAQHAQKRHNLNQNLGQDSDGNGVPTLTPKTDNIVLDGKDMNHVGRDSPLSRLWRSWRRNTRETGSRPRSPEDITSPIFDSTAHSRAGSYGRPFPQLAYQDGAGITEAHSPRQIPLPVTDRDVDEIEIPGLASAQSDSEDDAPELPDRSEKRPASMVIMPGAFPGSFSSPRGRVEQEVDSDDYHPDRPAYTRKRSLSSPTPSKRPFASVRSNTNRIDEQITDVDVEQLEANSAVIQDTQLQQEPHMSPIYETDDTLPKAGVVISHSERLPSQDQGTFGGKAMVVGGAMVAAATAAKVSNRGRDERLPGQQTNGLYEPSPVAPIPKRTVAEEMLGTGTAVPPPQDATTGASITNVADFDCMYVPMQMPPEVSPIAELEADPLSFAGLLPTRSAATNPIYEQHLPNRSIPEARQHINSGSASSEIVDHDELLRDVPTPVSSTETSKFLGHDLDHDRQTEDADHTKSVMLASPSLLHVVSHVQPVPVATFLRQSSESTLSTTSEDTVAARRAPLTSNPPAHTHTDSRSSVRSHHSKSSSSSSRLLGFTRDAQGRPQTISQQRASGGMSEDARAAHSSTPTSTNRDGRPETANSTSSKIFGKNHKQDESLDDLKKKSLEVLIRSNETLHYTLTPPTVMKENESFIAAKNRTETQDMADFIRNTGPPEPTFETTQRSDAVPPLPTTYDVVTSSVTSNAASPRQRGLIPSSQGFQQSIPSPDRPQNPIGQPRDARPEQSPAIRDLADYARSTGPMAESQLPRVLSPRPPTAGVGANALGSLSKSTATTTKSPNRLKFQARDPRPSRRAETSDLIDFIREGPPRAAGDHRIDRKVAPFRSTMDSEDFNNLTQPDNRGSNPKHSDGSSREARSGGPSINSQTALLANSKVTNGTMISTRATSSKQSAGTTETRLPRTQMRAKDPYAIDYSDDEDSDTDHVGTSRVQRNEESLIDFLRNTAPPPGMETQPILSIRPDAVTSASSGERIAEWKTNGAREASPHLTQSGSKIDKYKPTQATHAAHIDKSRTKSKFEPRDATMPRTGTSDLADYLKSSGPPPYADNGPQPLTTSNNRQTPTEKDGGLFKMFTKRKAR